MRYTLMIVCIMVEILYLSAVLALLAENFRDMW